MSGLDQNGALFVLAVLGGSGLALLFLAQEYVLRRFGRKPDGMPNKENATVVFVLNGALAVLALVLLISVMSAIKESSEAMLWAVLALLAGLGLTYVVGRKFLPARGGSRRK